MCVLVQNPSKCEQRVVICFLHAQKVAIAEIAKQLKTVYSDNAMSGLYA